MTDHPTENARLRAALERWRSYGCPDCSGDCGSANPPVSSCIMQETRAILASAPAPDTTAGAVQETALNRLHEAAKELHRDMLERAQLKMDVISGEQYRIVNAGNTAWFDFDAALRALAGETE